MPPIVKDLGEDFLAATQGELGAPEAPTVFMVSEGRFYTYQPDSGIFEEVRDARLMARLSELLLRCARDCAKECDTTNLEFRFRDTSNLRGLALIGVNLAQRMMVLSGTAGGGKGTFIRVLRGIIGAENLATLRPMLLAERFELGRFLGKSLLYGADVPENFLSCKGASSLKALIGGDPMTLEFKGSNERPEIVCRFNAIVTCNSRLTVHLEGDAEAWRRRLAIVEYKNAKPEKVIAELSEQILAREAPGVLNWMLEGLEKLRADNWTLRLSESQQRTVDDLLMESEADVVFARECLHREEGGSLTVGKCYEAYVRFCNERGWVAMPRKRFSTVIGDTVTRQFGMTMRHDLSDDDGKNQRGWRGLLCMGAAPSNTDVYV